MGCGMFLTRHPEVLSSAFQVSTGYMPSNVAGVDPYVTSVQWSRRFLGLRLFLSLAAAGWAGYARHVERAIELAALLKEMLLARGWTIANQSTLAVLCIEPPPGADEFGRSSAGCLRRGGPGFRSRISRTRPVIRACVTHGETTQDDIMELVEALETARSRLA